MKRGFSRDLFLISAVFILIVLTGLVGLVEGAVQTESETQVGAVGETTTETTVETGGDTANSGETDILHEVLEEHKDVELSVVAGITPDSAFYFIDKAFDGFQDPLEVIEEKTAEIKESVESGNINAAEIALENLNKYTENLKKEISPEEREDTRETVAAIANTIEEIKEQIPDDKKEKFVNNVLENQEALVTAAEIAAKISDLCNQLVKIGEFEKASEVCNLDENGDDPKWLRGKKEGWNKQLEGDAKNFFDVLRECMEVTSDEIKGNYDQCRCGEMPDAQQDLCYQIAKIEDEGGDASNLIDQFMKGLPNNLKVAVEKAMRGFEEEGFERHRPEECENVDSFDRCQEIMFRSRAPGPCLNALDRGEIEPTREACKKIMFRENVPKGCEGLDPDECAEQYGGPYRGRGGPGVVFQVCHNIKDSSARLACYDDNANNAEFTGDYYEEKREFRYREGFENFDSAKFDKGFRQENVDKYAELYASRRKSYEKYYYNEEDERRRVEETLDREGKCVQRCASEGKAWSFAGGVCQCFGGDYSKYNQEPYSEKRDYEKPPYNCAVIYCQPDYYCDPYQGCVQSQQPSPPISEQPPIEPTPQPAPTTEPAPTTTTSPTTSEPAPQPASTTGSIISGRVILENPFLKYYFGY